MSGNQTHEPGAGASASTADDAGQDVVRLATRTDADGASYAYATLTPADDTRVKEILADPRPIVPVIFLPGVMGTLLADKDSGKEIFYPPNTDTVGATLAALCWLVASWFRGAASREQRFDPLRVAITPHGPIDVGNGELIDDAEARRRGWGTIHRTSYHPTLIWLEQTLNNPMFLGKLQGPWCEADPGGREWTLKPLLGTDPADYGAYGRGGPITADSEEFQHFVQFRYRVYAIGYNWMQSNADSGRQVLDGFDYTDPTTKTTTRVMGIREICNENDSGKAIVVTHSMGGLVARFAVLEHGAEDLIHGVFHGAQPATGAPLAARRMRTGGGSEGGLDGFVNGALMGRDADEFVAVTTNTPGPLELLPMPDYRNGEPWWVFARVNGQVVMQLPKEGDAYNEIYLNSKWYGLLPAEELLDPAGLVKKRLDENGSEWSVMSAYKIMLQDVVKRQSQIINQYHKNTFVAYGSGALVKDPSPHSLDVDVRVNPGIEISEKFRDLLTWGKVIWTGDELPSDVTEEELRAARFLFDSRKGDIRVLLSVRKLSVTFTVQKEKQESSPYRDNGMIPGDGTVPSWSAEAQARGLKPGVPGESASGVKMAFVQAGYSHQMSFLHPWTRWALLYSVVQIVKNVTVQGRPL